MIAGSAGPISALSSVDEAAGERTFPPFVLGPSPSASSSV